MERLRGMLSAFRIMGGDSEIEEIDPEELKELAQEIARRMTRIGERYENSETNVKRENLLIDIYSETLRSVMAESRWQKQFSRGIIPVQIFFAAGVIDQRVFSAFIAVSAATTMIVPLTFACAVDKWKQELFLTTASCKKEGA